MGGCSSKPKTAEFEGSMDLHEGKSQNEDVRRSLEAEKIGVDAGLKGIDRVLESSQCTIQVLLAEKGDLHHALAETEKHLVAGFNPGEDFKEGMQILKVHSKHVKQALDETHNDTGVDKELSGIGETLKLQKDPEVVASELHKDLVFINEGTKELQDSPFPSAVQAETVNLEKEPLSLTKKSLEMEEKQVFIESQTLAEQKEHITSAEDVSELQVKPTGPQDETLELLKGLVGGGEELESHKEVYEIKEQRLNDGPNHKGQCKRIEEANKEFAVSEHASEDQNAKGNAMEEAAEGVTTSTSVDKKSQFVTTAVSPNDLQLMVGEQAFLLVGHDEQMQAKSVDEPVRADFWPSDDFQSNGETTDTTLAEGDYVWRKVNVGNKYLSSLAVVSEEPIHLELPENSAFEVQGEKLSTAFICNGGQLKLDVSSTSDQVTSSQITATTEKPEVQFVPVKEPAEPAFRKDISAQEISAPDIDEVWEKLASEFERQESLARITP
eukprot:c22381_g2_i1 orf=20-1507(-)